MYKLLKNLRLSCLGAYFKEDGYFLKKKKKSSTDYPHVDVKNTTRILEIFLLFVYAPEYKG